MTPDRPGALPVGQPSAMGDWPSHLRLWLVAILGLAADLSSKHWVFTHVDARHPTSAWNGFVELRRSLNAGAVFGIGVGWVWVFIIASFAALGFVLYLFRNCSPRQKVLHFTLGLILAGALGNLYDRVYVVADIVEVVSRSGGTRRIIGKIIEVRSNGSLKIGAWPDGAAPEFVRADRIVGQPRQQGVVRDFLKFVPRFPSWVPWLSGRDAWPWIFNLADAMLVCGVILLLFNLQLVHGRAPDESDADADPTPTNHSPEPAAPYATETPNESSQ